MKRGVAALHPGQSNSFIPVSGEVNRATLMSITQSRAPVPTQGGERHSFWGMMSCVPRRCQDNCAVVQTLPGREGWLALSVLEVRYVPQEHHKSGAEIVTGKGTADTENALYG